MRKLFIILTVVLITAVNTYAQNMLGSTYTEVRSNYTSQRDVLTDWEEGTNKQGVFSVSYRHKNPNFFMICFFDNGHVVKYVIADIEDRANTYAKAFNAEFTWTATNTWIDYSANCTWKMLLEDGMVYLEAYQNELD